MQNQPNIVVILTDDQGYWALGCAGNEDVQTPNIDRLAERGAMFENFFCTSPVCSPARASLLTGKIPSQHGIHDWLRHENEKQSAIEYLEGQLAYTEILKENGYACGISGKWHMGNSAISQKGFEYWYVHAQGGGPYYGAPMYKNGELIEEPKYITEAITDHGISFIDDKVKNNEKFYLQLGYTAPHSPWINQHPKAYVDMYAEKDLTSCPRNKEHPWSVTNYRENHEENLIGYYASITAMDDNIGRLMDHLEQLEVLDNTLIWFLSDNGFNFGHHGIWGKGNGTFPLNLFDTSIKVPAIVSHPDVIKQGQKIDSLVSGYDFLPTILAYLGLEAQIPSALPGKSFASILKGEKSIDDKHIVVYDEYGPARMIRNKEYKYIHRYPYGPHEFYHIAIDPEESNNLIDEEKYVSKINDMRLDLEKWFANYTNIHLDGSKEDVRGAGQFDRVGPRRKHTSSFYGFDDWTE